MGEYLRTVMKSEVEIYWFLYNKSVLYRFGFWWFLTKEVASIGNDGKCNTDLYGLCASWTHVLKIPGIFAAKDYAIFYRSCQPVHRVLDFATSARMKVCSCRRYLTCVRKSVRWHVGSFERARVATQSRTLKIDTEIIQKFIQGKNCIRIKAKELCDFASNHLQ